MSILGVFRKGATMLKGRKETHMYTYVYHIYICPGLSSAAQPAPSQKVLLLPPLDSPPHLLRTGTRYHSSCSNDHTVGLEFRISHGTCGL